MKPPKRQYGFNLTELMVAITIGLIVLAGASSVMISNKKTYTAQDSLARLQENARISMLILTSEMRNIGYWGCNPDMENVNSALESTATDPSYLFGNPVEGSEAGGPLQPTNTALAVTPRSGTDVFIVRGPDTSESFTLEQAMTSQSASMKIAPGSGLVAGEVLVITDCSSADIFQVTNINSSGTLVHNPGGDWEPGNEMDSGGNKLSKAYNADATIMRFKANMFYIDTGASGEPSLFRRSLAVTSSFFQPESQEMVEGIENLQVLYGVDTDGDKIANSYKRATFVGASTWNNVVSIRFGVIARALANLQTTDLKTAATASQLDTKPLDIDGDTIMDFTGTEMTSTMQTSGSTAKDRQYQRRMFRTTVLLRNMPK
ncbi:MAG: PilW family protein [Acidiferrobacterales bacterium]